MPIPNPKQVIAVEFCLLRFDPELVTGFVILPNWPLAVFKQVTFEGLLGAEFSSGVSEPSLV